MEREIEIIIWCTHCGHKRHIGERYTFFSQAFKDYIGVLCPRCQHSEWELTARLREVKQKV